MRSSFTVTQMASIASVSFTEQACSSEASFWAKEFNVPVDDTRFPRLEVSPSGLALCMKDCLPMHVDFRVMMHEQSPVGPTEKALLRACGREPGMHVIDATAGWGNDAAVLASSGINVQMIEHDPVLAVLLEDGLQRLNQQEPTAPVHLSLHTIDAWAYLDALSPPDYPDVIYMNPIHPARFKMTHNQKSLSPLQAFLSTIEDPLGLLKVACARVQKRVVVKWPTHFQPLNKPSYVLKGKSPVRFDVYFPSSL